MKKTKKQIVGILGHGEINTILPSTYTNNNCSNWTFDQISGTWGGYSGQAYTTNSFWTQGGAGYCSVQLQLYCFEQ